MSASVLTKEQRRELEAAQKEALAEMRAKNPTYIAAMAGASFSGGIWEALEHLYGELETAGKAMPRQFDPTIDSDILAKVDSTATVYLATDALRPHGGWSFSPKKRALTRELRRVMDERALMAALYLKQARTYLAWGQRGFSSDPAR